MLKKIEISLKLDLLQNKILTHFFVLLILLFSFSCKKNEYKIGKATFKVEKDLSYGGNKFQKFDLYSPAQLSKKTIIAVHGGGWRGGDKKQITGFVLQLMKEFPDYAFVNTNYTLPDVYQYSLPLQTDDLDLLLKHLDANSNRYKLNPEFILIGNSAGGHLSALYSSKYKNPKVQSVINIAGPLDLSDENFRSYPDYDFVEKFLADPAKIDKNSTKAEYASPVYWTDSLSIPMLSLFGNQDRVIPGSQKSIVDSLLHSGKMKGEAHFYQGDHESWRDGEANKFVLERIKSFLKH